VSVIFKFVMDTTQTPNSKVKIAAMNHLRSLAQVMEPGILFYHKLQNSIARTHFFPGDIPSNMTSEEQEMPLAKIVTWTIEPKSSDVRRASQAALSAIFTMSGPHFTGILQKLPKAYQVLSH